MGVSVTIATIVLGYDDGETAQRALIRAAELTHALRATLVVASVAPITETTGGRSLGADPADPGSEHRAELHAARTYLETKGISADYVEAIGHEGEALLAAARERGADLIVIGAGGRSLIERLLGHSVPDTVAHRADCDVLIVH